MPPSVHFLNMREILWIYARKHSLVYRKSFFCSSFTHFIILLCHQACSDVSIFWYADSLPKGKIRNNFDLIDLKTWWTLGQTYLSSFEATVDGIFPFLPLSHILPVPLSLFLPLTALITRGPQATSDGPRLYCCHSAPPLSAHVAPQPELEQGHNPFRQPPPKSEGMKHMLPQINHCDQSHGCTVNQWSKRLWKSSPVPDVPSNDYVVSGAKGNQQTSRNLEQQACQFSTLIKHTQVAQWYDASRAKADILWCLINWKSRLPKKLFYWEWL